MHETTNGVKVVMPTVEKIQKKAAVTKEVVTALQQDHACNGANAPSPTIRRGTKRKADSSTPIPPRRNYNLRRRNPPIPNGPAVRIELSDMESDDEEDSGKGHDNHSGEV